MLQWSFSNLKRPTLLPATSFEPYRIGPSLSQPTLFVGSLWHSTLNPPLCSVWLLLLGNHLATAWASLHQALFCPLLAQYSLSAANRINRLSLWYFWDETQSQASSQFVVVARLVPSTSFLQAFSWTEMRFWAWLLCNQNASRCLIWAYCTEKWHLIGCFYSYQSLAWETSSGLRREFARLGCTCGSFSWSKKSSAYHPRHNTVRSAWLLY